MVVDKGLIILKSRENIEMENILFVNLFFALINYFNSEFVNYLKCEFKSLERVFELKLSHLLSFETDFKIIYFRNIRFIIKLSYKSQISNLEIYHQISNLRNFLVNLQIVCTIL